ncbi:MAG: hypothetical protein NZ742_12640 [Acidobacteria bacterium]|nr:hypothetical protein [Acidobacteriota bacterium]MDW7985520.1 hypothetical protein [Acidobacteriota bacterium]
MADTSVRHRFGWLAVMGLAMGGMAAYGWVRVIGPVVRLPTHPSPASYALSVDIQRAAWWDLALPESRSGSEDGPIRRNLFSYSATGGSPGGLTASRPSDTNPPVVTVRVNETPKPPSPPPPSPLESIQLVGIIHAQSGEPSYAVLTIGRELWIVLPGQTFGPGARVVRIQPDSVLLETTDGSYQRTLAFSRKSS